MFELVQKPVLYIHNRDLVHGSYILFYIWQKFVLLIVRICTTDFCLFAELTIKAHLIHRIFKGFMEDWDLMEIFLWKVFDSIL
jgi:hypothetical protein